MRRERWGSSARAGCGEGEEGCPLTAVLEVDHIVLIARSWQNSLDQALLLPLLAAFKQFFKIRAKPTGILSWLFPGLYFLEDIN